LAVLELEPASIPKRVLPFGPVLQLELLPVELGFEAVIACPLLKLLTPLQKWPSQVELSELSLESWFLPVEPGFWALILSPLSELLALFQKWLCLPEL
jgi:hypothetical protein